MTPTPDFSSLGLSSDLLANLAEIGFHQPTEIQWRAIPELLDGTRDILGLAQTGTGKTASFALPIIDRIDPASQHVQAVILAPTRELAKQIAEEMNRLKARRPLSILPIYGGSSMETQIRRLKSGVQVVVGTPGRVIDLLNRKLLKLEHITHVVLDEADDMLNMGFVEDIETILEFTPKDRRMLLFSATMPRHLERIVDKHMKDKLEINLRKNIQTPTLTKQIYHEVFARTKIDVLVRIVDANADFYGIVFCRTKVEVDEVNQKLTERGYASEALHGDISQAQREKTVYRFKKKLTTILVATDVAARGVDIKGLSHVVNFTLPDNPETYIHRVGRTGRAGLEGTAISLVMPGERRILSDIKRVAKADLIKIAPPSVDDILAAQKTLVIDRVASALPAMLDPSITETAKTHCFNLAKALLEDIPPSVAVATLLRIFVGEVFDESRYPQIESPREEKPRTTSGGGRVREFKSDRDKPRFNQGKKPFSRTRPEFGGKSKDARGSKPKKRALGT